MESFEEQPSHGVNPGPAEATRGNAVGTAKGGGSEHKRNESGADGEAQTKKTHAATITLRLQQRATPGKPG